MWIKRTDGSYTNPETKSEFTIALGNTRNGTTTDYRIYCNNGGVPLASGFPSAQDAQDALDEFLSTHDAQQIPSYVAPENGEIA